MYNVDKMVNAASDILSTKMKRHLIGGAMLSVALLFGGIAFTIMTIRNEDDICEK